MENKKFQEGLIEDIQRVLGNDDVPLERVQQLAREALQLEDRYPDGIPEADRGAPLGEYGDIAKGSSIRDRQQQESAKDRKIDEIRKTLGLRDTE